MNNLLELVNNETTYGRRRKKNNYSEIFKTNSDDDIMTTFPGSRQRSLSRIKDYQQGKLKAFQMILDLDEDQAQYLLKTKGYTSNLIHVIY